MIKINDLTIDPQSLGTDLILTDITPVNEWKNGERQDTITGYKYTVAAPKHGLRKIGVKIEGKKRLETADAFPHVKFTNLTVGTYWSNGNIHLTAKADHIETTGKPASAPMSK